VINLSTSHLFLGHPSNIPEDFNTKIMYAFLVSPYDCVAQCNFLDFSTLMMVGYLTHEVPHHATKLYVWISFRG